MSQKAWYISPIGWLEITAHNNSLTGIKKVERPKKVKNDNLPTILLDTIGQLEEYFLGMRKAFDLRLNFGDATDFHKEVWLELLKIPYGKTVSYSYIAEQLGKPKSVRAVGQAAGANPIAIVVPCHRLIGKKGDLTGYFYGLDIKRELLRLENPKSFGLQGSLFEM